MTTVSTHDSETLALWWIDHKDEVKAYCQYKGWDYNEKSEKLMGYEELLSVLHDSHHSASLFHVNLLQEYLSLVPWLIYDDPKLERINLPGTVCRSIHPILLLLLLLLFSSLFSSRLLSSYKVRRSNVISIYHLYIYI